MVAKILERFALFQEKYALAIVLVVLTVTSFFAYYAVRLETNSSFDVLYRDDSDTRQLQQLLSNTFGSTDTLFVLVQVDEGSNEQGGVKDIRDPQVMLAMQELANSLEEETSVSSTISLPDILLMFYGKLPQTLDESKLMISGLPQNVQENYLKSFLSQDMTSQNMLLSVDVSKKPGSLAKIESVVRDKIQETPFPLGVKATLTGLPVLLNRIMGFIINDNIRTVGLAILGVILVLWIYFRSYKIALFSIVPVIFTLIWLAGTLYLLDIQITVMIASVGAMIIGMSVDYAIHLTHAYHEQVREGQKHAASIAVQRVGPALTASVLTTIVGFIALMLGVTPNTTTQGTVLAIGIAYAFIITMAALPPLMVLQRKYVYSRLDEAVFRIRGKREEGRTDNIVNRFLSFIAKWQAKRPGVVLFVCLVATLLIIPGFGLVYLDTDDDNWLPDNDEVVDSLTELELEFGGTESMNLLFVIDNPPMGFDNTLVTDLRDPRVMLPMSRLDSVIEELDWVDAVESPTNDIKQVTRVPHDKDKLKQLVEETGAAEKYSEDYSLAKVTLRFDNIDRPRYFDLMNDVQGVGFPEEVKIIPQGGIPEDIELEQSLQGDTQTTTLLGFTFVVITASVYYMSITAGLLAFIPIIIAITWTVGIMGYINLPFTVLTTGMLAILMGLGIDFSIHLMHAIRENMKVYGKLEKAIPEALQSTGEALSITTITTVLGFMVLTFATLVNTKRLGWTLALGILCTFLACILIVPSVMSLIYKIRGVRNE